MPTSSQAVKSKTKKPSCPITWIIVSGIPFYVHNLKNLRSIFIQLCPLGRIQLRGTEDKFLRLPLNLRSEEVMPAIWTHLLDCPYQYH